MATNVPGAVDATIYVNDVLAVMRQLPGESIPLIVADPPYFLSNGGTTVRSGEQVCVDKGIWDTSNGLEADHAYNTAWMTEALRVLSPGGSMWVSGTMHNIFSVGFAALQMGMRIVNNVTWFKPNAPFNAGCRSFTHSNETLLWLTKGPDAKHTFNYDWAKAGDFDEDRLKNPGKQMRDVWSIPVTPSSERSFGFHPTQKPLKLMERIIGSTSHPGETVLELFAGSGTAGVAAVASGRNYIGVEYDPDYACGIMAHRLIDAMTRGGSLTIHA